MVRKPLSPLSSNSEIENLEFITFEKQIEQEQKDILVHEVTDVHSVSRRDKENFDSEILDEHNAIIDKYAQRTAKMDETLGEYQKDIGYFGISIQTFGAPPSDREKSTL